MTNLRKQAELHLQKTLEGEFGLPVVLISPSGAIIDTDNYGKTLTGQVLYDIVTIDPGTGGEVIDNTPVVTFRLSSLPQEPKAGEKWGVKIPVVPDPDADKKVFMLSDSIPPEPRRSLGIIKLYLEKTAQKV